MVLMHTDRFEEYLETILYLIRKNQGPAKTKQISEELNVSPPSVTEMVKKLNSSGLVEYTPYQGVELTEKGADEALKIKRKHQVLETFLVEVLNFDRKQAHKEACELEHAVSDAVLEKIYDFLGNPEYCPDGNPINLDKNNIKKEESFIPLDEMEEGSSGRVARVTLPRETKERLNSLGILTGEDIEVRRKQKQGCISVIAVGSEVALGRDIAKKIFVSPNPKSM
jgi:DtxR family Mn-dependent transcriptional regulator